MHQLRLYSRSLGGDAVELVPRHHFICGDVEGMPNRLLMSEQPEKAFGEIGVVRDHPQRRTIARHNHLLAAQHTIDHRVRLQPAVDHQWN